MANVVVEDIQLYPAVCGAFDQASPVVGAVWSIVGHPFRPLMRCRILCCTNPRQGDCHSPLQGLGPLVQHHDSAAFESKPFGL